MVLLLLLDNISAGLRACNAQQADNKLCCCFMEILTIVQQNFGLSSRSIAKIFEGKSLFG